MKTKSYIRTDEHKKLMSEKLKGRIVSDEAKKNMSKAQLKRKEKFGYLQSPEYRKNRSELMKGNKIAKRAKVNFEEVKTLYLIDELSAIKIAERFGTTHNTILKLLKDNGIPTREQKFYIRGEKNKFWVKDKDDREYTSDFNRTFKRVIRGRDGCCMLCNISREDLELMKRKLCVHHVSYEKELSIPENCISLCAKCHVLTNINRSYWTKFFQSLLSERYGYKYSEDGKVILELNSEKEMKDGTKNCNPC